MAKVPPHLRRFIREEQCGSRKVWRAWLSFRNREKRKEFLSVAWVMQMAGALEQYGATPKEVEARSQALMASMLGIDKSTFNRRLGQFSAPDGRWDDDRRRRHSEKMRAASARRQPQEGSGAGSEVITGQQAAPMFEFAGDGSLAAAHRAGNAMGGVDPGQVSASSLVHSRGMRTVHRLGTLFTKNVRWGQAQLYGLAADPRKRPEIVEGKATNDAQLLAQVFGEKLFDPECRGAKGFKSIPGWVWDPRLPDLEKCECQAGQMGLHPGPCQKCGGSGVLHKSDPLPDYGRVLMTYLLLKGLEQYGSVEITQERIAEDLGMDVNTVAKYEDKWEALMIIRCIPGEVLRDSAGAVFKRFPHKIIWLSDRLLDEDVAQKEWARFQAIREKVADRVAFERAERLHAAVLKEWQGKEHSLKAFWNHMRRLLAAENIHQNVLDVLFPFSRE